MMYIPQVVDEYTSADYKGLSYLIIKMFFKKNYCINLNIKNNETKIFTKYNTINLFANQ